MKKFIFLFLLMFPIISPVKAQSQTAGSPGQDGQGLPAFDIQGLDSSTIIQTTNLTKSKPVVLLFFNTTCEHCQQEARDLVKNKGKLKKIQLVMISSENTTPIKMFYEKYSLSKIDHLIIGRDFRFAGNKFFMFESFPYCAIYTRGHKHIKSLERDFNTETILKELKKSGEL